MRIILTVLLVFSNLTLAGDHCVFEVLSRSDKYKTYLKNKSEMISLRTVETESVIPFFLIKSYSKRMDRTNLVMADDVVRDFYLDDGKSLRCDGRCQAYKVKETNFIEYYEFGGVTVTFLIDSPNHLHVFELAYDNPDIPFYDYYSSFECGGLSFNEALYNEILLAIKN